MSDNNYLIAEAIREAFSHNMGSDNNVPEGLMAIARAVGRLADVIENMPISAQSDEPVGGISPNN